MAESYPYRSAEPATGSGGGAAEAERLVARVRQEQAQLAADQRQLKQQRLSLDRLKSELDARQQELEHALGAFQQERQAFLDRRTAAEQALETSRNRLQARQDEVDKLAADLDHRQRQVEEQSSTLEAARGQLDAARSRLDALAASLESQTQALGARQAAVERQEAGLQARAAGLAQSQSDVDSLSQERRQLQADRQQLQQQATELAAAREQLARQEESFRDRQITLDAQQEDLRRQLERLAGEQAALCQQQGELDSQRENLKRLQADLASREASLRQRESHLSDLQARADHLSRQEQDLQARQADLARTRQDLDRLEQDLAQKQRDLDVIQADVLARQKELAARESLLAGDSAAGPSVDHARLQWELAEAQRRAADQALSLNKRLEGVQAELVVLREQKTKIAAERDAFRRQCDTLANQVEDLQRQCEASQSRMDEWMAAHSPGSEPVVVSPPPGPADAIAVIAAQAGRTRRRLVSDVPAGFLSWRKHWPGLAAGAVAALLTVTVVLMVRPAEHWVAAEVVLPEDSPLAQRAELVQAQRELTGRLVEGGLLARLSHGGTLPVTADPANRNLSVRLCGTAALQVAEDLKGLLDRYRSDLQSEFLVAAQTRQQAELARQAASLQAGQADLKARRTVLDSQSEPLTPQAQAYDAAMAAASKAREDLDKLAERYNALTAKLRLLRRTPPASRMEVAPEQIAEATASDPQLIQARNQVISRATDLRGMLSKLVQSASAGSGRMDSQLGGFLEFLAVQKKQAPDESLQKEIAAIAEPVGHLRQIVLDSRRQIDGIAGSIEQAQDVSQVTALVGLQADSEKALESLTTQAAEAIQRIDRLIEQIPAGGTDVTRRTVLQQRLRSQFAQLQKVHQELGEMLDALRPTVNLRLDAALTGVAGVARQLDERQKGLLEQIQQRQARQRRQEYDKQVQESQAQLDDLSIQRDRLLADLTSATDRLLKAEPARSRMVALRSQQEDLDAQLEEIGALLRGVQARQASLQASAASQAAPIRLEGPRVEEAAANSRLRMYLSTGFAAAAFVVVFIGYLLAATRGMGSRAAAAHFWQAVGGNGGARLSDSHR